jgi:peptidoglycan-associated lipoprotein
MKYIFIGIWLFFSTLAWSQERYKVLDHGIEKDTPKVFKLPNILYDLGKWNLRPESIPVIDSLVSFLKENPGLKIEIGNHTSRSNPKASIILSQKRAQTVADSLIRRGIFRDRITCKGYEDTQPTLFTKQDSVFFANNYQVQVASSTRLTLAFIQSFSQVEIQEALFQLNRRTEVKIISQ